MIVAILTAIFGSAVLAFGVAGLVLSDPNIRHPRIRWTPEQRKLVALYAWIFTGWGAVVILALAIGAGLR